MYKNKLRYENRIATLIGRNKQNQNVVKKLQRQIRKMEREKSHGGIV